MSATTFLDLVEDCDSFPYDSSATQDLHALRLPNDSKIYGYLTPSTISRIPWDPIAFTLDHATHTITPTSPPSQAFAIQIASLISSCIFPNLNKHSEAIPLCPTSSQTITLERFAAPLFGVQTRGAHLTAYVRDLSTGNLCIWVPRRSAHLHTWPGRLDSTVAGGVGAGETPWENILREGAEEASLPADLLTRDLRSVGVLTYINQSNSERGEFVCPDVVYCYDLKLDEGTVPKPCDDEVEAFCLMGVEDVKAAMLRREFKPNVALVLLDFFIRHGLLGTEELGEEGLLEAVQRMHRRLPFGRDAPGDAEGG